MRRSHSTALALPGLECPTGEGFFVTLTERRLNRPYSDRFRNPFALQLSQQPFTSHRLSSQPALDPSLGIGTIIKIPEIG